MFIFSDENDLIKHIERCAERHDRASSDTVNMNKTERTLNRVRAAAFREVLEYLKDYFAARQSK